MNKNMFTLFRTIPQFLKLQTYAFDISDFSYKFLSLKDSDDGIEVADFGEGEIPKGIIQNGEIKNNEKLLEILRDIIAKHNIKYVAISLPDEKGFVRFLKLSASIIKKEEIGDALSLQLEEHVPFVPSEAIFDYSLLREEKDHFDVVLRAIPRALVESYCSIFKEAGATPILIEQELSAITRAIVPDDSNELSMIIDWGKSRTSFALVDQGIVSFSSTISVGGSTLTDAIAKQLKITMLEAEQIKKTKAHVAFDAELLRSDEIMQAIIPLITVLREETKKYIQYWQTHSETSDGPKKIFLTGGDVFIPGFAEYLSKEVEVPVFLANSWTNIRFPKKYLPELTWHDSVRFSCAIGLCLKANKDTSFI